MPHMPGSFPSSYVLQAPEHSVSTTFDPEPLIKTPCAMLTARLAIVELGIQDDGLSWRPVKVSTAQWRVAACAHLSSWDGASRCFIRLATCLGICEQGSESLEAITGRRVLACLKEAGVAPPCPVPSEHAVPSVE